MMKSPTSNNNINAIKETRKLLNDVRSNLSHEETKRIRKKLYKKEAASYFFKEKEQEGSLTNRQKNVVKNIDRYIKNISKHLKNLKKHFKKSKKYQYDIDYLFNEGNASNNDINVIKEVWELFNELKSNYSNEQRKEIRKKLYNYLKEKEQKGSLTNKHKKVLKNITKYLKNLKKDLEKYQHNITYGIDYLFNELNEEDYYEPKEIKSAFDSSYILYESKGDKDARLSVD